MVDAMFTKLTAVLPIPYVGTTDLTLKSCLSSGRGSSTMSLLGQSKSSKNIATARKMQLIRQQEE